MQQRKRLRKTGMPLPPRGIKLAREKAIYDRNNLKSFSISYNGRGYLEKMLEAELYKIKNKNKSAGS